MAVTLREAFGFQRTGAKRRGIGWQLTFEQWLQIWVDSGHLDQRGSGKGRFHMARRGDEGAYEIGNVFIQLHEENSRDARRNHPDGGLKSAKVLTGRGRGWTYFKNGYQVCVAKRYIGRFSTQQAAEAAYRAACAAHLQSLET